MIKGFARKKKFIAHGTVSKTFKLSCNGENGKKKKESLFFEL